MIDWMSVARPYAKAAFEYASEHNALKQWSTTLSDAAQLVRDKNIKAVDSNPGIDKQQMLQLIIELLKIDDKAQKSFFQLLVESHKLPALECIYIEFEYMSAEHAKTAEVDITTAKELSESQTHTLVSALEGKFQRNIKYTCKIDSDLLGGVIIRTGDTVIDGSGRGRLKQLSEELI